MEFKAALWIPPAQHCVTGQSRPVVAAGFGPISECSEEPSWHLGEAVAGSSSDSMSALRVIPCGFAGLQSIENLALHI